MSNDDWQRNQNQNNLPGPGESWDANHEPKPLHQVSDSDWGTAPPPQNNHGQQYNPPNPHPQGGYQQAGVQNQPSGRRKPGSAPAYHNQGGYMTHQPNYHMQRTNTELDGTDIGAIIISAFFPGVGHMLLGQVTKGIVILALTYLTCGLGYIAAALICIDAYMVAKARKTRPVDEWEFLPK